MFFFFEELFLMNCCMHIASTCVHYHKSHFFVYTHRGRYFSAGGPISHANHGVDNVVRLLKKTLVSCVPA
ncbi:hypothetical protein BX666DRAFT_2005296 [Dichotomocladium elegans]|nr:hypothetical protein BX666DRAFT_2005296 [Dichotomocladium elegans]